MAPDPRSQDRNGWLGLKYQFQTFFFFFFSVLDTQIISHNVHF